MYKIIFYGISNRVLRMRAQSYLSDRCEIVGISDSFYTKDSIQGMKFIPYWEIANVEYDYVLLLTSNGQYHNKIENLLYKHGVPREKIIRPRLLWLPGYEYIPDLKDELLKTSGNGIANYCFGLSYSLRGIDFKRLEVPFIDCSWHGADLYYMNQCVQIRFGKCENFGPAEGGDSNVCDALLLV